MLVNPDSTTGIAGAVLAALLLSLLPALCDASDSPEQAAEFAAESAARQEPLPAFKISFEQAADEANPDLSAWAERTRTDLAANYPLIYEQLLSPSAAPPESVELIFYRNADGSIAYAEGGRIHINCAYVEQHYDDIGMPIHELVHVVQAYNGGDCPGWLTEGIADWIRYFWYEKKTLADYAGQDPGNYDSAYSQTARFLEWLRLNRNPDVVPQLNALLREKQYGESAFQTLCGAEVSQLWQEYISTLK